MNKIFVDIEKNTSIFATFVFMQLIKTKIP